MRSFNTIKIEELRYEIDDNKENKENQCQNIQERTETKDGMSSKKQFINFLKKEESIFTNTDEGAQKLKRSSRTIKKRDFNFWAYCQKRLFELKLIFFDYILLYFHQLFS